MYEPNRIQNKKSINTVLQRHQGADEDNEEWDRNRGRRAEAKGGD